MKNFYLFLVILCCLLQKAGFAQQLGQFELFNNSWSFHHGDLNQDQAATGWKQVDLPHDWSIEGPFSQEWASATGYLPGGIGWYKKTFAANPKWRGKQVYIYFDGVYKNSEVWINGHYLGKRPNGFITFSYELSPYLNYKEKNEIKVKVDHSEFADSRWYTGSGIYRNVYLLVKGRTHIDPWDVAFCTPAVTKDKATLSIAVDVQNNTSTAAYVMVQARLLNQEGRAVYLSQKKVALKSSGKQLVQLAGSVHAPQLWNIENPYLYQLQVSLLSNGKQIDLVSQSVGIRSIHFDRNQGFFLNGQNQKLKGVCIHDDAGALGVAVPPEVWIRRLRILKEAGVNSLRMSHNPHADYLYQLCDSLGFMVMDEAFDEWERGKNKWVHGWNVGEPSKAGYHEYFREWGERDLADQVRRDRNHPSIIMWSIGNEIDYPNDPYTHEILNSGRNPQIYGKGYLPDHPPAREMTPIASRLVKVVKKYDQTRPVTAALAGVVMSNEVALPEVLDVVGYNYQEYRYPADHTRYPDRIIYGSENGMAKSAWNAVDSNTYISGQYLWTGIDYLGEAGKFPQRSNGAGLIDLAGFKKTEYYYRQSLWADKPMVFLAVQPERQQQDRGIWSHRRAEALWNWPANSTLQAECFSNCDEVELLLNGTSLGKKNRAEAHDHVLSWSVSYQPGKLEAKGYTGGKEVCRSVLNTAGNASGIEVSAEAAQFHKGMKSLNQIEVQVADEHHYPVYDAGNEVHVQVTGPAKLVGLESGSSSSTEDYHADHRLTLHGRLLAYIQNSGQPGTVQVTFSADGLKSSTITYKVQ